MRAGIRLSIGVLAVAAFGCLSAQPAMANPDSGSTVVFTIAAGTLDISAPGSVDLGTLAAAAVSTVSAQLGDVTVNDSRRGDSADWTATVGCREFWGALYPPDIPSSAMTYSSGTAVSTVGNGTFTPGQETVALAVAFGNGAVQAFDHTGGSGANLASWNPTLTVTVPTDAVAQEYGSECTHSVA